MHGGKSSVDRRGRDRFNLCPDPTRATTASFATGLGPRAVLINGGYQLLDAFALGSHGRHDRLAPITGATLYRANGVTQIMDHLVSALTIGLVHHEYVANLENPGLGCLHAVAHSRRHEHQGGIGLT